MTVRKQEIRRLASRLLESPTLDAPSDDPGVRLSAVLRGFSRVTTPFLGTRGFEMLLARALNLAQREHPLLRETAVVPDGLLELPGSEGSKEEAAELRVAAEVIVAELIAIFARFLGAEMAIRLVRQAFSEDVSERDGAAFERNL